MTEREENARIVALDQACNLVAHGNPIGIAHPEDVVAMAQEFLAFLLPATIAEAA
ncbi:hypothetical protein [Brevundimonas sp.]|uniref:hypothetical protein n=1 Tax=Brevundimonas sp. TaxID=1871086 RepID=UPI0035B0EF75